jgi:hypothetical protein
MLRSVDLYLVTDVSGQPIGFILNGQTGQEECILLGLFDPSLPGPYISVEIVPRYP